MAVAQRHPLSPALAAHTASSVWRSEQTSEHRSTGRLQVVFNQEERA